MSLDFSIVIPAYNASDTLERSVNSIQKLLPIASVEILIIENGSTDETLILAKRLEDRYNNVKVFQSLMGVSNARNLGIEKARGEWLLFLDADDYFLSDLERLPYYLQGDNSDIVFFNYQKGEVPIKIFADNEIIKTEQRLETFIVKTLEKPTQYLTVWGKAFKRSILNELRFDTSLRVSEDSDFLIRVLLQANVIEVSHYMIYRYTIDIPSTMRKFDSGKLEGYIHSLNAAESYLHYSSDNIRWSFQKYKLAHFNLSMVREVFHQANPLSYKEKVRIMKKVSYLKVFKDSFDVIKLSKINGVGEFPLWLIKYHLYYLASFIYMVRVRQNSFREEKKL